MPINGGCDFATDPDCSGLAQPIFWTPQSDPATLVLTESPAPIDRIGVRADDLTADVLVAHDPDLLRIVIQGQSFDLAFEKADQPSALAAIVMLDDLTPDRLAALVRFWNAIAGKRIPPDPRMTDQRRNRARQMLRAVDARAAGATYRLIAESLFPRHDIEPAAWVGTAIRETTIRLVRDGLKLVRGGYRSLLRRPRRDR